MKLKLIIGLFVLSFMLASHGQVLSACLTMEQSQAKYNQDMANKIKVINTATQQQQCYYQQLATYWQQLDKDNQQKAKDQQQIAKDAQQVACTAQQTTCAAQQAAVAAQQAAKALELAAKEKELNDCLAKCTPPEVVPWCDDGHGGKYKDESGERWTCDSTGKIKIDNIPMEECFRMKGESIYLGNQNYLGYKNEYKEKHPECR